MAQDLTIFQLRSVTYVTIQICTVNTIFINQEQFTTSFEIVERVGIYFIYYTFGKNIGVNYFWTIVSNTFKHNSDFWSKMYYLSFKVIIHGCSNWFRMSFWGSRSKEHVRKVKWKLVIFV